MAKQKPGKKFKYDLQSVLKVRAIKEKKEQEKFADKQRTYMTEKEREEAIDREKKGKEEELREFVLFHPVSQAMLPLFYRCGFVPGNIFRPLLPH